LFCQSDIKNLKISKKHLTKFCFWYKIYMGPEYDPSILIFLEGICRKIILTKIVLMTMRK